MYISRRYSILLTCLILSYAGLSQTDEIVLLKLPRDTVFTFLGDFDMSRHTIDERLSVLSQTYDWDETDLFHTPLYYYGRSSLEHSFRAYQNLMRVTPQIIDLPEHQVPMIRSYSHMHRLDDIAPYIWDLIARHYDDLDYVTVPNAFYQALANEENYLSTVPVERLEEKIYASNTRDDETKISLDYSHEKMLISRRALHSGESFYFSELRDGQWTPLTKDPFLSIIENTESAASIDASGRYVVFTECMSRAWDAISGGGCDLWFTTYIDDTTWAPAQKYLGGINTPAYEGLAAFTTDGRQMYFSSNREGGIGGKDIWYCSWDGMRWTDPANAGPTINSAGDDISPFVSEDGHTLFFSSDRHGNLDIYMKSLQNNSTEDTARRLDAPINTKYHELSCHVISQTGRIIVATNSVGDHKNFDLQIYDLPEDYHPRPQTAISGQILYLRTLEPVYAEYGATEEFLWESDVQTFTNIGNGWYFWELQQNKKIDQIVIKNLSSFAQQKRPLPVDPQYRSHTLRWNLLLQK